MHCKIVKHTPSLFIYIDKVARKYRKRERYIENAVRMREVIKFPKVAIKVTIYYSLLKKYITIISSDKNKFYNDVTTYMYVTYMFRV